MMTNNDTQTGRYIDYAAVIRWPTGLEPAYATFFIHNEVVIDARVQDIWHVLVDAARYPTYYAGAKDVKVLGDTDGILQSGSVFTWKSLGYAVTSRVRTFEENWQLGWSFERRVFRGHHAWLLVPDGRRTILITQETQNGFLAHVQNFFAPRKLYGMHDRWLFGIKSIAETRARLATVG